MAEDDDYIEIRPTQLGAAGGARDEEFDERYWASLQKRTDGAISRTGKASIGSTVEAALLNFQINLNHQQGNPEAHLRALRRARKVFGGLKDIGGVAVSEFYAQHQPAGIEYWKFLFNTMKAVTEPVYPNKSNEALFKDPLRSAFSRLLAANHKEIISGRGNNDEKNAKIQEMTETIVRAENNLKDYLDGIDGIINKNDERYGRTVSPFMARELGQALARAIDNAEYNGGGLWISFGRDKQGRPLNYDLSTKQGMGLFLKQYAATAGIGVSVKYDAPKPTVEKEKAPEEPLLGATIEDTATGRGGADRGTPPGDPSAPPTRPVRKRPARGSAPDGGTPGDTLPLPPPGMPGGTTLPLPPPGGLGGTPPVAGTGGTGTAPPAAATALLPDDVIIDDATAAYLSGLGRETPEPTEAYEESLDGGDIGGPIIPVSADSPPEVLLPPEESAAPPATSPSLDDAPPLADSGEVAPTPPRVDAVDEAPIAATPRDIPPVDERAETDAPPVASTDPLAALFASGGLVLPEQTNTPVAPPSVVGNDVETDKLNPGGTNLDSGDDLNDDTPGLGATPLPRTPLGDGGARIAGGTVDTGDLVPDTATRDVAPTVTPPPPARPVDDTPPSALLPDGPIPTRLESAPAAATIITPTRASTTPVPRPDATAQVAAQVPPVRTPAPETPARAAVVRTPAPASAGVPSSATISDEKRSAISAMIETVVSESSNPDQARDAILEALRLTRQQNRTTPLPPVSFVSIDETKIDDVKTAILTLMETSPVFSILPEEGPETFRAEFVDAVIDEAVRNSNGTRESLSRNIEKLVDDFSFWPTNKEQISAFSAEITTVITQSGIAKPLTTEELNNTVLKDLSDTQTVDAVIAKQQPISMEKATALAGPLSRVLNHANYSGTVNANLLEILRGTALESPSTGPTNQASINPQAITPQTLSTLSVLKAEAVERIVLSEQSMKISALLKSLSISNEELKELLFPKPKKQTRIIGDQIPDMPLNVNDSNLLKALDDFLREKSGNGTRVTYQDGLLERLVEKDQAISAGKKIIPAIEKAIEEDVVAEKTGARRRQNNSSRGVIEAFDAIEDFAAAQSGNIFGRLITNVYEVAGWKPNDAEMLSVIEKRAADAFNEEMQALARLPFGGKDQAARVLRDLFQEEVKDVKEENGEVMVEIDVGGVYTKEPMKGYITRKTSQQTIKTLEILDSRRDTVSRIENERDESSQRATASVAALSGQAAQTQDQTGQDPTAQTTTPQQQAPTAPAQAAAATAAPSRGSRSNNRQPPPLMDPVQRQSRNTAIGNTTVSNLGVQAARAATQQVMAQVPEALKEPVQKESKKGRRERRNKDVAATTQPVIPGVNAPPVPTTTVDQGTSTSAPNTSTTRGTANPTVTAQTNSTTAQQVQGGDTGQQPAAAPIPDAAPATRTSRGSGTRRKEAAAAAAQANQTAQQTTDARANPSANGTANPTARTAPDPVAAGNPQQSSQQTRTEPNANVTGSRKETKPLPVEAADVFKKLGSTITGGGSVDKGSSVSTGQSRVDTAIDTVKKNGPRTL